LKIRDFWNRPGNRADFFEGRGEFADAAREGSAEALPGAPVVGRAERFRESGRAGGDQCISRAAAGGIQQLPQEIGPQTGHIAGDNQVPVRRGVPQRRKNAAQGTFARVEIGHNSVAARTASATACARVAPDHGSNALSRPMRELCPPTSTYPARLLTEK